MSDSQIKKLYADREKEFQKVEKEYDHRIAELRKNCEHAYVQHHVFERKCEKCWNVQTRFWSGAEFADQNSPVSSRHFYY